MSALKELDRLSGMEKRITTLEVIAEQTSLSIDRIYHSVDRLDRSVDRLDKSLIDLRADVDRKFMWLNDSQASFRSDMDRKFTWVIGTQIAMIIAAIGWMVRVSLV